MPRAALAILVYALALIFVMLGVVMAFGLVVTSAQDEVAQTVLRWIAAVLLFFGLTDLLVLVLALGLDALDRDRRPRSGAVRGSRVEGGRLERRETEGGETEGRET